MENVLEYLPGYVFALIIELVVFFEFVYFVSIKTDDEVARRWKASAFISVCIGLFVQLVVLALVIFGWFIDSNPKTFVVNLSTTVILFFAEGIIIGATITMPMVMISLFNQWC